MSDSEQQNIDLHAPTSFPLVWDNTMAAEFASCEQKGAYSFFHNIAPQGRNVDLHAGASFAKGLEDARKAFYVEGKSQQDALAVGARALMLAYGDFDPGESVKTMERMLGALGSYCARYPFADDALQPLVIGNKPAIEFNFAHPIPEVAHPTTGEPLIYCGRFDMLGILNRDPNLIMLDDEKTTKQLGATWPAKWDLRSQFLGYTWGCRKSSIPVKGAVVRGLSILKTGYGHSDAIKYYPDWLVTQWYEGLVHRLRRAVVAWSTNYFDRSHGDTCTAYSGCQFRTLCTTKDPQSWVNTHYMHRVWDPMKLKAGEEI